MDKKIIYPKDHLHYLLNLARSNIQKLGFKVIEGVTIWSNDKCVSESKEKRANRESYGI